MAILWTSNGGSCLRRAGASWRPCISPARLERPWQKRPSVRCGHDSECIRPAGKDRGSLGGFLAARNFADQGATETPGTSTVTKNRVRDGVPTVCQNPDVILRVISLGLLTDSAFASLTALARNVSAEWLFFRAALARDMPEHCSPDEHVLHKRRGPRSNFFPAGSAESGGVGMAALSGALLFPTTRTPTK